MAPSTRRLLSKTSPGGHGDCPSQSAQSGGDFSGRPEHVGRASPESASAPARHAATSEAPPCAKLPKVSFVIRQDLRTKEYVCFKTLICKNKLNYRKAK